MPTEIAFIGLSSGTHATVRSGTHDPDPRNETASLICAAVENGSVEYPYDPAARFVAEREGGFLLVSVEIDERTVFAFGTAASDDRAKAGWERMHEMLRHSANGPSQATPGPPSAPWSASCVLDQVAFLHNPWLPVLQGVVASTWVGSYELMRGALDGHDRTGLPSRLATQFELDPPFGSVSKRLVEAIEGKRPSGTLRRRKAVRPTEGDGQTIELDLGT
jgi:hypothetical protein